MSINPSLSPEEAACLQNADFLRTKRLVVEKNIALLYTLQEPLHTWASQLPSYLQPYLSQSLTGKVSQGENYQELPYQIFDYPRLFTSDATLALRTMIWWGQYYSVTLHLGGAVWEAARPSLAQKLEPTTPGYVGIGDDPFAHHFGPENYLALADTHPQQLESLLERDFVKLGMYWPLEERELLVERVRETAQAWGTLLG